MGFEPTPPRRKALRFLEPNRPSGSIWDKAGPAYNAALLEAKVPPISDDDVIEHGNTEQFTSRREASGYFEVIERRSRIAGRMIVTVMCLKPLCGRGQ